MNEETAKEIIGQALLYIARRNGRGMTDFDIALMLALCALEKQIPKKAQSINESTHRCCPVCGHDMIDIYCAHCGQRLDWSEE